MLNWRQSAARVMRLPLVIAVSLLALSSFAATSVAPSKTELETMYSKAFREFDADHYDAALKALDAIDARQPDLAESQNLRGVVLMRKGAYDEAEKALRKALEIEPKFWNAQFNLAEIPFLKKDWPEARNRFEALAAGNSDESKGETSLLIQYKILLTFVLDGKENLTGSIMSKFKGEKGSPALYYSNAALALHRKNQKEADKWMKSAEEQYPSSSNKLFAESFYEIGWLQKPEGEPRAALEITSTSERTARLKADAQANFERAERSFQQRDFPTALKFLDLSDAGAPNQAAALNLRGEIYLEEQKFDKAEKAFREATDADPKFREAQYNLAQIPFKERDYAKARERLEKLFAETPGGEKNQAAQLIKYKIFMTLLLEGKEAQAQQMMDQFKFTGDTPALYYAQAAWSFKHDNRDQGSDWIKSAQKIYSTALNVVFADAFYDLGWLKRTPEAAPTTAALAQADAEPPGPTPALRLGEGDSMPKSVATSPEPEKTVAAPVASNTAAAIAASAPARDLAKGTSPSSAAVVVAETTPAAVASLPTQSAPFKSAAMAPVPKASAPAIANRSPAVSPAATALAPAQIRDRSQPTPAEKADRIELRTLLIAGLLLGGLVIGWLIVQQWRRGGAAASFSAPSQPLTGQRFRDTGAPTRDERRVSRENLEVRPPKLSVQLKGNEPTVSAAARPSGAIGARPDLAGKKPPAPDKPAESVSVVKPVVAAAKAPKASAPVVGASPNEPKTPPPVVQAAPAPVAAKTAEPKPAPPVVPKTPVIPPKAPAREEKEIAVTAKRMSAFLSRLMPAKAAVTPPPTIIAEPRAPLTNKVPVAVEPKPPVAPSAKSVAPSAPTGFASKPGAPESKPAPVPVARQDPAKPTLVTKMEPAKTEAPKPAPTAKIEPAKPAQTLTDAVSKRERHPVPLEPQTAAIAAIAGAHATPQSSLEPPSIVSKIITTKPTPPSSFPSAVTQAPLPVIAANEPRPTPAGAPPASALQTAVQLTFSLEIASLQLTPLFKIGSLQLKPISKIVSMRLAPSAQPIPALNLQVTFALASVQLGVGASLGVIRLMPSGTLGPAPLTSPSFEISGLHLVPESSASPVRLTPTQQGGQASVLMTASFQIATVEFSPSFEVASVVLNATSKNVALQLPGTGPGSLEGAAIFEIGNVQLDGNKEIGMIQLNPLGDAAGRQAVN